jgi:CRISPR/Cas system-associated exonuclease Cas4 (RecB family)
VTVRPPTALARTRPWQASRLATVAQCALRYLFETEVVKPSLPDTLPTMLGRAAHRVLEAASARGTRSEDVRPLLVEMTLADLAASPARIPRWVVRHGLLRSKGVVPAEALGARVRFVISRLVEARERRARGGGSRERRFGPEVRLESAEHDLVGIADRIDFEAPGLTAVTEFKTGALRVEPGDAHRVQLLAYGLMVARRDECAVSLRAISPAGIWGLEFGPQGKEEILQILKAASARLPRDVPVAVEAVATPGSACLSCRYRPICAAYHVWALQAWRRGARETPLDVWGTVTRVTTQGDLFDLHLFDDSGTAVRVTGIALTDSERPPMEGARIRLFELASAENLRSSRRPLNYLAADRFDVRASAWSATIEW